jgi:hypothetical protein
MKQRFIPEIKMKVCGEIRKHFSPWCILKVLDTFNQSLKSSKLEYLHYSVCVLYFPYSISKVSSSFSALGML